MPPAAPRRQRRPLPFAPAARVVRRCVCDCWQALRRCLILRQSSPCLQSGQERGPTLQHPVMQAVARRSHAPIAWHDMCTRCGMRQPRPELMPSSRLLWRKGFTGSGQRERIVGIRQGDHGSGSAEEWSLASHSRGQEPWSLGFKELVRLQREAGDADGLDGELPS